MIDPLAHNVNHGEHRLLAVGIIRDIEGERIITVVYTRRNGRIRIISARAPRAYEREAYAVGLDDPIRGDRTDWARLAAMTDEENDANIAGDFDAWPLDDQARGFFFYIHPDGAGAWTWDMVDRDSRVVARAPATYADWNEAEAATLPLRDSLKAA